MAFTKEFKNRSNAQKKAWRNRSTRAARIEGMQEYWESRRSSSHRKALSRAMKKYHRCSA
jgi:hypothetical protein